MRTASMVYFQPFYMSMSMTSTINLLSVLGHFITEHPPLHRRLGDPPWNFPGTQFLQGVKAGQTYISLSLSGPCSGTSLWRPEQFFSGIKDSDFQQDLWNFLTCQLYWTLDLETDWYRFALMFMGPWVLTGPTNRQIRGFCEPLKTVTGFSENSSISSKKFWNHWIRDSSLPLWN